MSKLTTTSRRIAMAIAAGLALPTLAIGIPMAWVTTPDDEFPRWAVFIAAGVITGLLMGIIGAPAWIVLHRRGARLRTAAAVGAVVGALIGAAVGAAMVLDPHEPVEGPLWLMTLLMGGIGAAVSGGTCALMWWIAYPRRLQLPPAESFF